VLLAADGVGTNGIVDRLGVSKPTVIWWKKRYAAEGVAGLEDRPKPGRPQQIDEVAIVLRTLEAPPDRLGVTHWSSRLLGAEMGLSNVTIAKVWKRWGLQPWRVETFKFSTDPELEAKVRDVVAVLPGLNHRLCYIRIAPAEQARVHVLLHLRDLQAALDAFPALALTEYRLLMISVLRFPEYGGPHNQFGLAACADRTRGGASVGRPSAVPTEFGHESDTGWSEREGDLGS